MPVTPLVVLMIFGSTSLLISAGLLVSVRRKRMTLEGSVHIEKGLRRFFFFYLFLLVSTYVIYFRSYSLTLDTYQRVLSGYLLLLGLFCFGFCLYLLRFVSKKNNIYIAIASLLLQCTAIFSLFCIYEGIFGIIVCINPNLNRSIVAYLIVFSEIIVLSFMFFIFIKRTGRKR